MDRQQKRARVDALMRKYREQGSKSLSEGERAEVRRLTDELDVTEPDTRGVRSSASTPEDKAFTRYLRTGDHTGLELRTTADGMSNNSPASDGGYLVPPGFWTNLQIAMKAYAGLSNDFRLVETATGNPMQWPTVDPTSVVASILGDELTSLDVASPYVFGLGTMSAFTYYTSPILASRQLVTDSAFDVDEFLQARIGEQIGRAKAAHAVSGTGSGEPLGLITALNAKGAVTSSGGYLDLGSATAVPTLTDLDGSSTTELAANLLAPSTLLDMIGAIDPVYRDMGAKFYVNDAQLKGLRSVVDQYGRPLLQDPSHESGNPTLWGYPVVVVQEIPDLQASTTGGPVFGHMATAMVERRVTDGTVMMLRERYADYLAYGWIGYQRSDFRSNDLRAAVTVKPAST